MCEILMEVRHSLSAFALASEASQSACIAGYHSQGPSALAVSDQVLQALGHLKLDQPRGV
jgi:hypothetical protein